MKIDNLPAPIASLPDLRDKGLHLDPLIMPAPRHRVGHAPGHDRMVLINHSNLQVMTFDVDEAQKSSGVAQQRRFALHNPGGVNMRHIIRNQQGKGGHVVCDKRITTRPLCGQNFAFNCHPTGPSIGRSELHACPDSVCARRTERPHDQTSTAERIGEAVADNVVILDIVDIGRHEVAIISLLPE